MSEPTEDEEGGIALTVVRKNPPQTIKLVFMSQMQAKSFLSYRKNRGIARAMDALKRKKFDRVKVIDMNTGKDTNEFHSSDVISPRKTRAQKRNQNKSTMASKRKETRQTRSKRLETNKRAKVSESDPSQSSDEEDSQEKEKLESEKKMNLEMGYTNGIRPEGQMRIFVQPYSENHGTLDLLTVTLYAAATVIELKAVIQARTGGRAQLSQQVLVTTTKPRVEMEDSKALQYYNVEEGSTVFLIVKPPEQQQALVEHRSQPMHNAVRQYEDVLHAEGAVDRPRPDQGSPGRKDRVVRIRFTEEEVESLIQAVREMGLGSWQAILHDPKYGFDPTKRSSVDLKDKWRNLSKLARNPDKARTTKLTLDQIERILQVQALVETLRTG